MRSVLPTALLVLAAACGSGEGVPAAAGGDPRDAGDAALRVFATGETRGFLVPCGCEEKQFGGIARRATYLASAKRRGDLRVDLGNAASGAGRLASLRLRATLDALDAQGYAVFVPGELELLRISDLVAESGRRLSVQIVAANVLDAGGARAFAPWVLHDLPDGRCVAIVGLSPAVDPAPRPYRVAPPASVLRAVLGELRGKADLVVVATSMAPEMAFELTRGLQPIRLVLATRTVEPGGSAGEEGLSFDGPPVAEVGEFGGFVRRVDLSADLGVTATWRAWLGEEIPEDAPTAEFVRRVRGEAIALDPELVPDILRGLRDAGYVGSEACAECHRAECDIWSASGHARAMATLRAHDADRDPTCVPCHLVDVRVAPARRVLDAHDAPVSSGEAVPADPVAVAALGVGCEACHGGRAEHVRNAVEGVVPPGGAPAWPPRDSCRGCHHPPEVKRFDFGAAWERIRHGDR